MASSRGSSNPGYLNMRIPADKLETIDGSDHVVTIGWWGGEVTNVTTPNTSILRKEGHTYSGGKTPSFLRTKASGAFIPPLTYVRYDVVTANLFYDRTITQDHYGAGTYQGHTTFTGVRLALPEDWITEAESALCRLLEQIDRQDLMNLATARLDKNSDIGPFLATIGQARGMVVKALKALINFSAWVWKECTRRGFLFTVTEVVNEAIAWSRVRKAHGLSDFYLEILYGWRPLVSDLETIYKQLKAILLKQTRLPPLLRGQSDKTEAASLEVVQTKGSWDGWSGESIDLILTTSGEVGSSWQALAYGRNKWPDKMFALNPFSTAWDLVPFSFVVDWVFNLSAMFKAFQASYGVTILGGCIGQRLDVSMTSTLTFKRVGACDNRPEGLRLTGVSGGGEARRVSTLLVRTPCQPKARLPSSVKIQALLSHLPETLALLIQKMPERHVGQGARR